MYSETFRNVHLFSEDQIILWFSILLSSVYIGIFFERTILIQVHFSLQFWMVISKTFHCILCEAGYTLLIPVQETSEVKTSANRTAKSHVEILHTVCCSVFLKAKTPKPHCNIAENCKIPHIIVRKLSRNPGLIKKCTCWLVQRANYKLPYLLERYSQVIKSCHFVRLSHHFNLWDPHPSWEWRFQTARSETEKQNPSFSSRSPSFLSY